MEVRELARKFNLPVASKSESQDLCFLGDGDYRRFLTEHSLQIAVPGPILDGNGRQLGQHKGLSFYTIGQRKGLGISTPEPVFVLQKGCGTQCFSRWFTRGARTIRQLRSTGCQLAEWAVANRIQLRRK